MKLLPCPFCGSQPVSSTTGGSDERCGYNYTATVRCSQCTARLSLGSNYDKQGWCNESIQDLTARTLVAWNTRMDSNA
jgi:hypothetical protein